MPDLIITINDEAVDLNEGQVVALTKQSAKVGDFSKVLANGTNQITIPLTAKNKRILDNAHIVQAESGLPYTRMPAKLSQEGVETIQDGFAIFEGISGNVQLQIVGGNANFFNRIKDLNLRDLPLSDYDHFWTNANVFANRNNTSGLLYALFEQGDATAGDTLATYGVNLYAVRTEQLLPLFFIKTLVEKIFTAQNYSFDAGDLTSLDIYTKATVQASSTPNRGADMSYLDFVAFVPSDVSMPGPFGIVGIAGFTTELQSQASNFWSDPLQYGSIAGNNLYLIPDNGRVTLNFDLTFDSPGAGYVVEIRVWVTSADGVTIPVLETLTLPSGTSTHTFTHTVECFQLPDRPECGYGISMNGIPGPTLKQNSTITAAFEYISNLPIVDYIGYFQQLPFNYVRGLTPVPDMKQGDFLKEIAKIYQLIFDTDDITATVTARRFDEVKDNIPNAIDLSDKIDDRSFEIDFKIDGFAQTNKLLYQPDDITSYTGEGFINVANENLDAEKTYVEVNQFAATSAVTRFDTVQAPNVPLFTSDGAYKFPTNGMKDRILLVRQVTFGYNINFNRDGVDLPTSNVTFAYFAEPGNDNSLDFPTIIDRFYQTTVDMNTFAKTISCKAKLFISDVKNYSPFIPVYVSKFNSYFYLEKIENYIKNKLTKIKLIKI